MREPTFKVITDERILVLIITLALLWRVVVSLDQTETLWEGICSGISLFVMGWALFWYLHSMSKKPTRWSVTNKIYHGIGLSLLVLNLYVVVYYGMRWSGLLHVEAFLPLDYIFRDVRYVTFVMFYCAILWSAKYLEKMREEYRFLLSRSKPRKRSIKERVLNVIIDERTLLVLIGIAFLWRTVISFDYTITFWESMCSYIVQLIIGWFLFGYLSALSVKVRNRLELMKVIQGFALALCTINVYALFYYGINWYSVVGMEGVSQGFSPTDFIFIDVRFFALVLFYYTVIVLSKLFEQAYADYTVPITTPSTTLFGT